MHDELVEMEVDESPLFSLDLFSLNTCLVISNSSAVFNSDFSLRLFSCSFISNSLLFSFVCEFSLSSNNSVLFASILILLSLLK